MTVSTIEDVAKKLEEIIAMYIEFKQLRDVSQEIGKSETQLAKLLEAARRKPSRIDPLMVADYIEQLQSPLRGVLEDFETFVEEVSRELDTLMWEVEV